MDALERRQEIAELLRKNERPISALFLSEKFNVPGEIIAQDILDLIESGEDILFQNAGYFIRQEKVARLIKSHHEDLDTEGELNIIVDLGGYVEDVIVKHLTYGEIRLDLKIKNREDVDRFVNNLKTKGTAHLKNLTKNYHYHTVYADSEEILNQIEEELDKNGYLVK